MKRRGGWSRVRWMGEEVTVTFINARSQMPSRCDEGLGFYGDCWKPLEVRAGWCLLIRCPFHGFTLSAVLRVSLQRARGGAGKHTKILGRLRSSPGKSWRCLHQGYNQEGVPAGWMLDVL